MSSFFLILISLILYVTYIFIGCLVARQLTVVGKNVVVKMDAAGGANEADYNEVAGGCRNGRRDDSHGVEGRQGVGGRGRG